MKRLWVFLFLIGASVSYGQTCVPGNGLTCTPSLGLFNPPYNYPNWNVIVNQNWSIIDTASTLYPKLASSNTYSGLQIMPTLQLTGAGCGAGTYAKADGTGCGPGGAGSVTISGSPVSGNLTAFSAPTVITSATPSEVANLLSTLTGCSTPNNLYSPANGNCIGGGTGQSIGTAGQLQMVGATTGSFAASSATDNGTTFNVSEPFTDDIVNGVSYSCRYPGFTLDERVNNAEADAHNLANGNTTGTVDASCETGTLPFYNPIVVLSYTKLILPLGSSSGGNRWQPSNGGGGFSTSQCAITQDAFSAIVGGGNKWGVEIENEYTTNEMYALYCTDTTTNAYYYASGFLLSNFTSHQAYTSGAQMILGYGTDTSLWENIQDFNYSTSNVAIQIGIAASHAPCCGAGIKNSQFDSSYEGGTVLKIVSAADLGSGAGWVNRFSIENSSFDHAATGYPEITCTNLSNVQGLAPLVQFSDLYEETGDTTTTVNTVDGCSLLINGQTVKYELTGPSTATIWSIANYEASFALFSLTVTSNFTEPVLAVVDNRQASPDFHTDAYGFLTSYIDNASAASWATLQGGNNSTSAFVCASGCSVEPSTGIIQANQILGIGTNGMIYGTSPNGYTHFFLNANCVLVTNGSTVPACATDTALPNGTTATTQTVGDGSNDVATDAFVLANGGSSATVTVTTNSTSASFYPMFVNASATGTYSVYSNPSLSYNPGTNVLSAIFEAGNSAELSNGSVGVRVGDGTAIGFTNNSTIVGTPDTLLCRGGAAGIISLESAASCTQTVAGGTATVAYAVQAPGILYSAAGIPVPACGSSTNGYDYTVSDATTPTYLGTYTSGGAITAQVICSYNGSTYALKTH